MIPVRAAAFLISSLVPAPLFAQVNVEPIRKQVHEQGAGARIDASMTAYRGNTQGLVLGGGLLAGVEAGKQLAFLSARGDYAKLGGDTQVDRSFAHARYNYELAPWLFAEAFTQLESDRFRRIQLRALVGVGPRFGVLQEQMVSLFYGSAYMLEHTELNDEAAAPVPESPAHRFSNYVALSVRPDPRIHLSNVTYYQPRFDDFGDYRLLDVLGAGFTVTQLIETRIDATLRYESRHPDDVEALDLTVTNSISLRL